MTFISPLRPVGTPGQPSLFGRKVPKLRDRVRLTDEDGARRALGGDGVMSASGRVAVSIEHLARIALG